MNIFGLVGKNIDYSFSAGYFSEKFRSEKIDNSLYKNFDIPDITYFPQIVKKNKGLVGLNVTIPYKETIIPYLDELSEVAEQIGAVNCIKINKKGELKGYNTDVYGFLKSLQPLLKPHHAKALILGTGGASKAVSFVFKQLNIEYKVVSRTPNKDNFTYSDLTQEVMKSFLIIVNCTPLGTYPDVEDAPALNYDFLSSNHLVFDLIYNPSETTFLKLAKQKGALTKNGYDMLVFQAEKAWEIWNQD